jgi:fumarylacetoacetase
VVSGTSIHRPKGQTRADNQEKPEFGPSRQMDFELEVGFVIGKSTTLGDRVSVELAEEYIFGLVLFNDLSARDIQKWEYVPLGPFLCKNFGSVISPWIVTLDALEPFRTAGPPQEPKVLPYLQHSYRQHFDIKLEVEIDGSQQSAVSSQQSENSKFKTQNSKLICRSNLKHLYWSIPQMLAHHTVNGCNIEVGDIYATGTISGPEERSFGSMLEIAWKGTKPVQMPDGSSRKFIEDNDTVIMRGHGEKDGIRVGFGECKTTILPAK